MSAIGLNHQNILEINMTPAEASPTWAPLKQGFVNITEAINEVIYQASYLGDNGWGSSEVTGGQYTPTLTGKRYFGDPAQDYIFSDAVMYNWGEARKTQLRITRQNGNAILWNVTLANITLTGGDANTASDISLTIHGNGAPTILTGGLLGQLIVVSVPAAESGRTAVYINPALSPDGSYKYKTAASVALPVSDEVLAADWTAWNGTASLAAVTGDQIVIVEADGSGKAKKAGRATVTSAV